MNYVHDSHGSVHLCAQCARNQNPDKPCPIWDKWERPDRMLNCDRWRDHREER